MTEPTRPGGSWAVHGCLYGAVGLFVILLLTMIFLAYQRFREETGRGSAEPVSTVETVTSPIAALPRHRVGERPVASVLVPIQPA